MGTYDGGQNQARPGSGMLPAYHGSEPYVFVSYAHRDKSRVYPEIRRFNDAGFHVWYDEGITPGSTWTEELAKAIRECAVFVVMMTPAAAASENVQREIYFAVNKRRPFLAIHLEETELDDGLMLQIGMNQAILKYKMTEDEYAYKYYNAFTNFGLRPSGEVKQAGTRSQAGTQSQAGARTQAGTRTQSGARTQSQQSRTAAANGPVPNNATQFKRTIYKTAETAGNTSSGQTAGRTSGSAANKTAGQTTGRTSGSSANKTTGQTANRTFGSTVNSTAGTTGQKTAGTPAGTKTASGKNNGKGGKGCLIWIIAIVVAVIYFASRSSDSTNTKTTAATTKASQTTTAAANTQTTTEAEKKVTIFSNPMSVTLNVGEETTVVISIHRYTNDLPALVLNYPESVEGYAKVEWIGYFSDTDTIQMRITALKAITFKTIQFDLADKATNEVFDSAYVWLKINEK